jgi:hypothetical protein
MISDDFWNVIKAINENVGYVARSDMKRRLKWLRDLLSSAEIAPPGDGNYRDGHIRRSIEIKPVSDIDETAKEDVRAGVERPLTLQLLRHIDDNIKEALE